ncbi:hypothetical protein A0J61_04374 [Choanephora cucurbitarum]|uniref:Uncharacterized protein n=1 Tax=Choanephora cucurbitarum TaxID=101091 RepID=A0A1C7NEM5_9FUNG|nr:hypothetical protein A0J61_04374 [Choanephora cucurbitarum]
MHPFFKFLDHYTGFPASNIPESCNLSTLLELLLSTGFSAIPDNHWIVTKRPRYPHLEFRPDHIVSAFWSEQASPTPFRLLCTASLRASWVSHWAFVRQSTTFTESVVISKMKCL